MDATRFQSRNVIKILILGGAGWLRQGKFWPSYC
jgi:hypothetical protein